MDDEFRLVAWIVTLVVSLVVSLIVFAAWITNRPIAIGETKSTISGTILRVGENEFVLLTNAGPVPCRGTK